MEFLNFTCRPEQQAIYTNYFGSAMFNVKSLDYLHPKYLKRLPTYPENLKKLVKIFTDQSMPWIIEHSDEMNEKWNEWVSR